MRGNFKRKDRARCILSHIELPKQWLGRSACTAALLSWCRLLHWWSPVNQFTWCLHPYILPFPYWLWTWPWDLFWSLRHNKMMPTEPWYMDSLEACPLKILLPGSQQPCYKEAWAKLLNGERSWRMRDQAVTRRPTFLSYVSCFLLNKYINFKGRPWIFFVPLRHQERKLSLNSSCSITQSPVRWPSICWVVCR